MHILFGTDAELLHEASHVHVRPMLDEPPPAMRWTAMPLTSTIFPVG